MPAGSRERERETEHKQVDDENRQQRDANKWPKRKPTSGSKGNPSKRKKGQSEG